MKQLLIIAIALTSVNAFATRARVTALSNAPHLVDTQTVYTRPSDIMKLTSDYANIETGSTAVFDCDSVTAGVQPCQNSNAEGMIVRTMGDAKLGLSLGHQSDLASNWGFRSILLTKITSGTVTGNQQNPVELTYGMHSGDMNWAGTLIYSSYNNKLSSLATGAMEKESSTGLRLGMNSGMWDASLRLGLVNTVDVKSAGKYTGTLGTAFDVGYTMDSMYFSGGATMAGYKYEDNNGDEQNKYAYTQIRVSVTNSVKKDGNEFFYGVGLNMTSDTDSKTPNVGTDDEKSSSMTLPVSIGLEAEAASWLTLRGSVTQKTLINSSKSETGSTTNSEFAPDVNSTTVALGAGLKFNKMNFDGTLSTSTTQKVNSSDLLGQVGMTYWF